MYLFCRRKEQINGEEREKREKRERGCFNMLSLSQTGGRREEGGGGEGRGRPSSVTLTFYFRLIRV